MPIVVAAASTGRLTPTASTTVCVLANNVLRELGDYRYEDTHSNSVTSTTNITLTVGTDATTRYEVGGFVEWREDCSFDRGVITSVAATSLGVRHGVHGSTAAAHSADAVFVYMPRFDGNVAQRAVNDAISSDLYPDVYAVYQDTFTPASPHNPYLEASASAEKILRAYQRDDASPTGLHDIRFSRVNLTDTTTSSTSRYLYVPSLYDSNNTIFVQYAIKPAIGDLTAGMARAVQLGACWRLLAWEGSEALGTVSGAQDGSRAPGQQGRDSNYYRALQRAVVGVERSWLRDLAPTAPMWKSVKHYA